MIAPRSLRDWIRIAAACAALNLVPLLAAFQDIYPACKMSGSTSRAQVIYKVDPNYSEEAKAAKQQGEVWLSVTIDASGIPTDVTIACKLGLGLDEQAIAAVKQWRFKPTMKDGAPIAIKATIAVAFHLP